MSRYGSRTRVGQAVSNFGQPVVSGVSYGVATGGTSITAWSAGGFNYNGMQFTSDGTLTVTKAGVFDVCMVAGGGGGNIGDGSLQAGGGGAGGVSIGTLYLDATTYAIDVGAGGAHQRAGFGSQIGTVFSAAGGGHGGGAHSIFDAPSSGGSGGGGNGSNSGNGGAGTGNTGGGGGGGLNGNSGGAGGSGIVFIRFRV